MVQVVKPSVLLEAITPDAELLLERAARTCYKSEHKMECDDCCVNGYLLHGVPTHQDGLIWNAKPCPKCVERAGKFIRSLIERGHESTLEHAYATFRVICDRGVTHEIVRHRLCAFSQESTRYCNYAAEKYGKEITVIEPPGLEDMELPDDLSEPQRETWLLACKAAEDAYIKLSEQGVPPQIARSVLPTCLKTEIIWSADLREWRHILLLRTSPKAHPQMREIMEPIRTVLKDVCPNVFFDR